MIVDDELDICKIMKRAIELDGNFAVDVFDNPLDALSHFKADFYDIALIDIRMPQIDGVELYLKMKKVDGKLKACFITAFESDRFMDNKEKYPDLQATCFIKKPILMKDLIETVKRRFSE